MVRYEAPSSRSAFRQRIFQIVDFMNRHALAVCAYEVKHLFDQFRIVFTNGIRNWMDADILVYGEWHSRDDLTKRFVSNWAPGAKLLIGMEGTPSMQPADDQQLMQYYFFDDVNVKRRDSWFMGWDAEERLMPKGNCSQVHLFFLSLQQEILDEIDGVHLRLISIYKEAHGESVDEGLHSISLEQLQTFANLVNLLQAQRKKFVQKTGATPLIYLTSIQKKVEHLNKILIINNTLKTHYPNCWNSPIGEREYKMIALELSQIVDRLQQLHIPLLNVQMELSNGLVTKRQQRETFPDRTSAMASTLRSIGQWISQGMTDKTVLVAGAVHVDTPKQYQGKKEYCLDPLYEELRNHKVAVVCQNN